MENCPIPIAEHSGHNPDSFSITEYLDVKISLVLQGMRAIFTTQKINQSAIILVWRSKGLHFEKDAFNTDPYLKIERKNCIAQYKKV